MSRVLARLVQVQVGDTPLAGLTDCSLNLTTAFATSQTKEDITPVDEPLRVDWEISATGEFGREGSNIDAGTLKGKIKTGAVDFVKFAIGDLAIYRGRAICTSYTETAPVDGKTTYSVTYRGVSLLNKYVEPEPEPEE